MKHKAFALRLTLIVVIVALFAQVTSALSLDNFAITDWRCDGLTYSNFTYMADRDNTGRGSEAHHLIVRDSTGTIIHEQNNIHRLGEVRFADSNNLTFNRGIAKGNRMVFLWTSNAGNGLPEVVLHSETAVVNCAPGSQNANENGQSNRNNNGNGNGRNRG